MDTSSDEVTWASRSGWHPDRCLGAKILGAGSGADATLAANRSCGNFNADDIPDTAKFTP